MEAPKFEVNERPRITNNMTRRLQECELINNNEVTEEGDLVYMALMFSPSTIIKPQWTRHRKGI